MSDTVLGRSRDLGCGWHFCPGGPKWMDSILSLLNIGHINLYCDWFASSLCSRIKLVLLLMQYIYFLYSSPKFCSWLLYSSSGFHIMNTLIFYGLVHKQVCKDVTAGTVHQGEGWSQAGLPRLKFCWALHLKTHPLLARATWDLPNVSHSRTFWLLLVGYWYVVCKTPCLQYRIYQWGVGCLNQQ